MKFPPPIRQWLLVTLATVLPATLFGQEDGAQANSGSVFGQVKDSETDGELADVRVLIEGTPFSAASGSDGRWSILLVPPGTYNVIFSKSGFEKTQRSEVKVVAGEATRLDVVMRLEMYELPLLEVVGDPLAGLDGELILERQKDPVIKNAIGSEMISQLGLSDAAEAVAKVPGVSVAGGRYAVIRGLSDRYTSTMLNGTDFPSADPNRKAAQLDLVPAQFIQQLDVSKTFTPDLPGGFAGGAIDIVTKRYPEEFMFKFSVGVAYNTQASLKDDFLTTDRGKTDWLGLDDGTRELPPEAANSSPSSSQNLGEEIKSSFGSRQFSPISGNSPVDSSFSFSFGDQATIAGRKFGYLAGMNYKNEWNMYTGGLVRKYDGGGEQVVEDKTDNRAVVEYSWGAMVALAFELNDYHELGFNFLRVQRSDDEARRLVGQSEDAGTDPEGGTYLEQTILAWTQRSLTYYQLLGEHDFPNLNDSKFNWTGAISSTTQDEPDLRIFQFLADPINDSYTPFGPARPERPNRTWRTIEEDAQNLKGDFEIPIPSYNDRENLVKAGGSYLGSERDFIARSFDVRSSRQNSFYTTGDPQDYLSVANEPNIDYRNFSPNFAYQGSQDITGGYLMADWAVANWLRLVGGARMENTKLAVDTQNIGTGQRWQSQINQNDILPSLGATIFLRENLQLKLAWSETLVRPIYREISRAAIYDVALARQIQGNEGTRLGSSQNYDVRLDWFPKEGSLISASLFYKTIEDPIELIQIARSPDLYQYTNYSQGTVQGVEFELRENLGSWWRPLNKFDLGFNVAFIQSSVDLLDTERRVREQTYGETSDSRPLYDQPEYVVNGDITWNNVESGTKITLSGGAVGNRLVAVGTFQPDEYLLPAPTLDFFWSQDFGEHWNVRFSAKNLLNPEFEVDQIWPVAGALTRSRFTNGRKFGLSVGYSF